MEEKLLPDTCRYGVFEKDGTYVYGNLSKEEQEGLWKSQMQSSPALIYGSYWKVIEKENGLTALVEYQVIAKFSNPFLRSVFPNAELLFVGAYFLMFFGTAVALAKRQGKYLQKRLNVLKETAERVEREDLDFEREYSDIQEVDHVLGALYQMKEALQKSLKEQWISRDRRRIRLLPLPMISKRPLRSSGEIQSFCWKKKQRKKKESGIRKFWTMSGRLKDICRFCKERSDNLTVSQTEDPKTDRKRRRKSRKTSRLLPGYRRSARGTGPGRMKKLQICCRAADTDKMIYGRKEECSRALWNIVSNGVDFSPLGGELLIEIKESGEFLAVTVTDEDRDLQKKALLMLRNSLSGR